jgi:hypothetical protein
MTGKTAGTDLPSGEKLVAPVRRFGRPLADEIRQMGYTLLQSMFNTGFPRLRRGALSACAGRRRGKPVPPQPEHQAAGRG